MKIGIFGAGLSGVFAANYFSSKGYSVELFDKKKESEFGEINAGVFRLKSRNTEHYLGWELKKISIKKAYIYNDKICNIPDLKMNNLYSIKLFGELQERSILAKESTWIRYLPTTKARINPSVKKVGYFNVSERWYAQGQKSCDYWISTIPMDYMVDYLYKGDIKDIKFTKESTHKYSFGINIKSEVNQTFYVITASNPIYRITIQFNQLIVESMRDVGIDDIKSLLCVIGLESEFVDLEVPKVVMSPYGKISPIDEDIRRRIIMKLTNDYKIFSFGRYAVWKPKLMIDDLLEDAEKINRQIKIGDTRRIYESFTN
jgi:hypothetical protein